MLLSTELVAVVLFAFVLVKTGPYYSIPHKLLKGITFWLAPNTQEIHAILPRKFKRSKQRTVEALNKRVAQLPIEIEKVFDSKKARVTDGLLVKSVMYEQLDTVIFVACTALGTFLVSDIWSCIRGTAPQATSFYALISAIVFCIYSLLSVFAYLASDDAKLAWITALLCAVFAFAILSLPRGIMDFDIEAGLEGTAESMTALLKTLKLNVTLAPSANVFKVLASLFSALIGMLTVLPAFRFSRAYYDLTTKHVASPGVQAMFHVSFMGTLVGALMFARPLSGDMLLANTLVKCDEAALQRDCLSGPPTSGFIMSESAWYAIRLNVVLLVAVMRILLLRPYIQSFLTTAKSRAVVNVVTAVGSSTENSERKAQRLTDKIVESCRIMFQFICPASVQLLSPAILLIMFVLVLHRRGDVSLGGCALYEYALGLLGINASAMHYVGEDKTSGIDVALQKVSQLMFDEGVDLSKIELLPPVMWRAFSSYVVFFLCASYFIMSSVGVFVWQLRFAGMGADQDFYEKEKDGEQDDAEASSTAQAASSGKRVNNKKSKKKKKAKADKQD